MRTWKAPRRREVEVPEWKMKQSARDTLGWLGLTLPIAILLAMAAGGGVFIRSLYRDNPYFVAQAIGQDHVSLAEVLPTLIIAGFLARRGSPRAWIVWLGALVYLVYTYAIAAFDVQFNLLFLAYVALLGCSLYALIGSLATADIVAIKACFGERTPIKVVGIYLAILAFLFYFIWLREIIPALMAGRIPQSIQDNGTPTNAVQVLDMAWVLPAFGIAAIELWRKRPMGYVMGGTLLSYVVFMTSAIMGMAVFMMWGGFSVAVPQVVIFGALLALSLGMLIWYMKNLKSPPMPSDGP
jgi:hypothetical protein